MLYGVARIFALQKGTPQELAEKPDKLLIHRGSAANLCKSSNKKQKSLIHLILVQ